jgi:hypothetical protein
VDAQARHARQQLAHQRRRGVGLDVVEERVDQRREPVIAPTCSSRTRQHRVSQHLDAVEPVEVAALRLPVADEVGRAATVEHLGAWAQVDVQAAGHVDVAHRVGYVDLDAAEGVDEALEDVEVDDDVVVDREPEHVLRGAPQPVRAAADEDRVDATVPPLHPQVARQRDDGDVVVHHLDVEHGVGVGAVGAARSGVAPADDPPRGAVDRQAAARAVGVEAVAASHDEADREVLGRDAEQLALADAQLGCARRRGSTSIPSGPRGPRPDRGSAGPTRCGVPADRDQVSSALNSSWTFSVRG